MRGLGVGDGWRVCWFCGIGVAERFVDMGELGVKPFAGLGSGLGGYLRSRVEGADRVVA